jgi:two-component system cell cycle sensor histidine kinase/response regulator CckA
VRGTTTSLHDVVVNLLVNAVDALPEGGRIVVQTRESRGEAVLGVRDTGVGMDGATRRRVFEPFFTTKPDVGTGLGLSTVYGTVTRWGGTVDVDSTPGSGTAFTIRLPLWHQPIQTPEPTQPDIAGAGRPGRLLLVEDDSGVAGFLDGLLSEEHEVVVARDGRDGLARFEAADFDVVLIDLGLPGTPGDRLAMRMREVRPEVATILITGWNLEDGDSRLAAFDFRVKKPFDDLRRLLNMVRQAVGLRDSREGAGNGK